jgi:hypothetical protein
MTATLSRPRTVTSIPIRTRVFKNGNSLAVRIPSTIGMTFQRGDFVEFALTREKQPHEGWDEQFKRALAIDADTTVVDEYGTLHNDAAVSDGLDDLLEDWSYLDA